MNVLALPLIVCKILLIIPKFSLSKLSEKPFKSLNGQWIIHEKDNHCEVSFEIKFEFKSLILEKIIGVVFFKAVKSIVKAFEEQCLKNENLIP